MAFVEDYTAFFQTNEFASLATSGIQARRDGTTHWEVSKPGAVFQAIEKAPVFAYVPTWPWAVLGRALRVMPTPILRRLT